MPKLIVNADDFGQTKGVSDGIVEAHRSGIVTSTTIMANGAAFEYAIGLALANPRLGVGIHLNLVEGNPVCGSERVPSLLGNGGKLLPKYALLRRHALGQLDRAELRREIEAQIDCVSEAGLNPTHVDAHKNIHAYPPFFRLLAEVASDRGIGAIRAPLERLTPAELLKHPSGAIRVGLLNAAAWVSKRSLKNTPLVATEAFAGTLKTGAVSVSWLLKWLPSITATTTELMVHPGHCDDDLIRTGTRLTTQRVDELRALTDERVIEMVRNSGITLIHYGDLAAQEQSAGETGLGCPG